jgi:hypothetical protein
MSTKALGTTTAATLALAAAGCGGGDDTDTASRGESAPPPPGATAPQSAGGERPPAPDDAISDRPGGPGDDGAAAPGQAGTRPASPSDERRIEATVRRYIAALNGDDGQALCALLAPGALQGVDLPQRRGSCAASLRASIGHRSPGGTPRWLGTRLVDADAVVLVRGGDGRLTGTVVHRFAGAREPSIEDDVVYLRKLGGDWRLAKPSASFYRAIGARDVPITALTPPARG